MTLRTMAAAGGAMVAALALAGCADNLPCNEACTPEMWAAQDPLTIEPIDQRAIFGKHYDAKKVEVRP